MPEEDRMKILLVDDAQSVAMVLTSRLRSFGHQVLVAENGAVAVDSFREFAPDLVLMDIQMPVMDGFKATDLIRKFEASQEWAWTPIIFLTGSDTTDNLVTAIEAGGDDLIAKNAPEPVLRAKMKAMARVAGLRQKLATANANLLEQANRDGLTGLLNRRHMDERTDAAWAHASQVQGSFAVLMIDIDNFKRYNDHYGHQMGDECLRSVATAIDNAARHSGLSRAFAARYGGEEFAIILPNVKRGDFELLAMAVVTTVRNCAVPHEKNADWGIVTTSVGGAFMPHADGLLGALFRSADQNLYLAKNNGRNRAQTSILEAGSTAP
jgi:diguanylate cyclase (GGDEF)-like protein